MSSTDGTPPENPYVGPRPFRTGERLYGRDRERAELRDLLIAQRIVVMYAPSGAGKTSLIQAALVPELEQIDFHVLPIIRINQPLANSGDHGSNRYVRSALLSLDSALPPSDQCDPDELAAMTLSDYVAARPRPAGAAPSDVLIFDQFEEILTLDPTDLEAKRAFFAEVGQLLRNEERWAIFALREDHIAALDPFLPAIPTRLATPFRLDLLGPEAARMAMQQPALSAGSSFTDDAAQRLVDDLRRVRLQQPDSTTQERLGPYIEPVQLQVVCQRLWEHLGESNGLIDSQLVDTYGNVDSALRDYFADSVKAVAAETGVPERNIRAWFDEQLITEHGVRGQVLWEPEQSAGLDDRAVNALVDRHLVRRESRRGALWFELAHDRLIVPIQLDNDAWYQVNLSALQQQASLWHGQGKAAGYLLTGEALEQAEQWAAAHPNVLTEVDRAFLTDSQEQRTLQAAERREQELIAAQRVAEEAQARQQAEAAARLEAERRVADQIKATRLSRILTALAAVAALVAGVFFVREQNSAEDAISQRATAVAEANRAESLRLTANSLWRAEQALHELDPRAGLLLSVEALNNDDTPEATRALLQRLVEVPGASRIWPEPVATLKAGDDEIRGVAFSHDGERLVSGDQSGKVTLWRPSGSDLTVEMSIRATNTDAEGAVRSITFAPNDLSIAVAGESGVRLLDPSSLEKRTTISEKPAASVAYFPKSDAIVYGNADGSVSRVGLASSELVELQASTDDGEIAVNAVAVSSQSWVAAGRDDGSVLLWNAAGGRFSLEPPIVVGGTAAGGATHPTSITCLTFDRLGTRLAAGDSQGTIWQWELDLGSQSFVARDPLKQSDLALIALSYSGSGTTMTATDEGGHVVLWDIERDEIITEDALNPGTRSVTFAPLGGSLVVSGGGDGELYLWSQVLTLFSSKEPFALETTVLGAVAFSPVGDQLAVSGDDGNVQLCDLAAIRTPCGMIATGLGRISSLALSNNGLLLASGDSRGTVVLHSLEENREVLSLSANSPVTSLAFSADDQRLVAGVEVPGRVPATGSIEVFDLTALSDGERAMATPTSDLIAGLQVLQSNPLGIIHGLTIDRDAQRIAVAGSNGIAWNLRNGTLVMPDRASGLKTWSVAFSPDGNQIASGSHDGRIYLWDTENQSTRPSVFGRINSAVVALKWLDHETLIAVGADGLVIEFSLDPQTLKSVACKIAGRDFEPAEAQRLFQQDVYQVCAGPGA